METSMLLRKMINNYYNSFKKTKNDVYNLIAFASSFYVNVI